MLIDESWGFAPYNTWSTTTGRNILNVAPFLADKLHMIGVVRAYPTRHGPGPFPTFDVDKTIEFPDMHNPTNRWQGSMRTGLFDMCLFRYALDVCSHESGTNDLPIDGLAITHLDLVNKSTPWEFVEGYHLDGVAIKYTEASSFLRRLPTGTAALTRVVPFTESSLVLPTASTVAAEIERHAAGPKVWIKSFGPTARDKEATDLLPLPTT